MADYTAVQKALKDGADPSMLCTTCPWDRHCITPPTMTSAEIDARMAEAQAEDKARAEAEKAAGREPGMPTGSLLTVLTFAGKDTAAQVCPVFAAAAALQRRTADGGRHPVVHAGLGRREVTTTNLSPAGTVPQNVGTL